MATSPEQQITMSAEDCVDAALAGLDSGKLVTIPSLHEAELWTQWEVDRRAISPKFRNAKPAPRYGIAHKPSEQIMSRLAGKIAIITGANSGIGRAAARTFLAEGAARVYITGRRQTELGEAAASLPAAGNAFVGHIAEAPAPSVAVDSNPI